MGMKNNFWYSGCLYMYPYFFSYISVSNRKNIHIHIRPDMDFIFASASYPGSDVNLFTDIQLNPTNDSNK